MPQHDAQTTAPENEGLTNEEAEKVEGISKILAEHLYARPMTNEQDEQDDNSEWKHTSEVNKRIFRSCALDVFRYQKGWM